MVQRRLSGYVANPRLELSQLNTAMDGYLA
jgi:hypothetical protein